MMSSAYSSGFMKLGIALLRLNVSPYLTELVRVTHRPGQYVNGNRALPIFDVDWN